MILHLVTLAKALLGYKVAYSQVQGLGCGHFWVEGGISHQGVPRGEDKIEKFPVIQFMFLLLLMNF